MKKHIMIPARLLGCLLCLTAIASSCQDDYPNHEGDIPPSTKGLEAPHIRLQYLDGTIYVDWASVDGATAYDVYVQRSHWGVSGFIKERRVNSTYFADEPQHTGYHYYKVKAIDHLGNESPFSNEVVYFYNNDEGSGGEDEGPGEGEDNPEEQATAPSAPTGVRTENVGSALLPEIRISWNSVSGAESYEVYRSKSANGSYSLLRSTSSTYTSDFSPYEGKTYYKIKAVNQAGKSGYSSYAAYEYDASSAVAPCPVSYGNCTVSGTSMTLRWSVSTSFGCGEPDRGYLRVRNPDSGEYADVQTLSARASSASFNYLPWVDDNGYVYAGIILENSQGISGGVPKIYDTNSKRWMN